MSNLFRNVGDERDTSTNEIRPQIKELQEDLLKEVAKNDIEEAVQTAQEDLHLNQGKLMKETKDRIYMQNEIARISTEALKADLRKEAETLESRTARQMPRSIDEPRTSTDDPTDHARTDDPTQHTRATTSEEHLHNSKENEDNCDRGRER